MTNRIWSIHSTLRIMCSIAGLMDKNGYNVSATLLDMLKQTSHRGPDGCGIYVEGVLEKANDIQTLKINNMHGSSGLGHSRLQITGSADGVQPLTGCYKRFILGFNGEIWNYKELRADLISKGHVFETDSDSEVIVHLIEENYKKCAHLSTSVLRANQKLDGEFAFVIFDNITKKIILTRDPVGVKPLYYGQNKKYVSFCSEKKPLWKIGIIPKRVLPGEVIELIFDTNSTRPVFKIHGNNELSRPFTELYDQEISLERYKQALFNSVKKRIDNKNKIGIIFSGGIDSVLIARVAQLLSYDITCYTSGFRESSDVISSINAAKKLDLDLKIHELSEKELKSNLENIVSSIESTNHLQIDVAIPIFFAVKEAKKDNVRVMLTGQGADEIFAGYSWYPEILRKEGGEILNQNLWNDIKNLYKDTLEREDKITMYHSIELRVPYLDPEVIRVAMSISENLKIKDDHVKYIHRKLAQDLGVPIDLAWRKKEAAQHGSNVHNKLLGVLENMAKISSNNISHRRTSENLGSAYRYNHSVYQKNEQVQNLLDVIGERLGLYPAINYAES
ncbi:MAG TPA: asparagine synthase (glutamine-hydrolyzing) [Candidatus Nitrosotalea sp.]|nr:asparagine synthase (glutamine-hydrolyzing) [Candidatus Nitrosotalea sp.]